MKKIIAAVLAIMLTMSLLGQGKSNQAPPIRERLFFGGYFSLQFGSITNIEVSPTVGLWVLPRLAVAAGPSFQYYADPYDETNIYGGSAYAMFMLIRDLNNLLPLGINMGIFAQAEYEGLSMEKSFVTGMPDATGRIYSGAFLLGAGISQPLGGRSKINLTFLWALDQPEYYTYSSPEIRISFNF